MFRKIYDLSESKIQEFKFENSNSLRKTFKTLIFHFRRILQF